METATTVPLDPHSYSPNADKRTLLVGLTSVATSLPHEAAEAAEPAAEPAGGEVLKCDSYSRSRARFCMAYGRYACKNRFCAHRSCGLHVIRNDQGIYCPQCGGPVRASKH